MAEFLLNCPKEASYGTMRVLWLEWAEIMWLNNSVEYGAKAEWAKWAKWQDGY